MPGEWSLIRTAISLSALCTLRLPPPMVRPLAGRVSSPSVLDGPHHVSSELLDRLQTFADPQRLGACAPDQWPQPQALALPASSPVSKEVPQEHEWTALGLCTVNPPPIRLST